MSSNPTFTSVQGQLLLAMPGLAGSFFSGALIYMVDHSEDGAFGLVINHPLDLSIDDVLRQLYPGYSQQLYPQPVLSGGPVENQRGFVLHHQSNANWEGQLPLDKQLAVTSSSDILQAISEGENIGDFLLILGYAGWGPGQLESELADNAWLTLPADEQILFNTPLEQRAQLASQKLGFDYRLLSGEAGHS